MRPLWNVWRCRHNARVFMLSLATLFTLPIVLMILAALIHQADFDEYVPFALAVLVAFFVVWSWKAIRQARARRRERLQHSPLSCDELRVARSKLMKDRNVKSL